MLFVVVLRGGGKIESPMDVVILSAAVLGLDFVYYIFLTFVHQMTYTLDFLLLLIIT
jgi:hypothetical protein